MSETPLLTRKLIGFRCWRITYDGVRLAPRLKRLPVWKRGTNEAKCYRGLVTRRDWGYPPLHTAPSKGCNCGLHAYRDLATVLRMEVPEFLPARACMMHRGGEGWVLGAVAAWGEQVEVHDDGFRAQFMAPIALTHHGLAREGAVIRARNVARANGLRFLPFDELEEFASNYGTLLPNQLRPGVRKAQTFQAAAKEALQAMSQTEERLAEVARAQSRAIKAFKRLS